MEIKKLKQNRAVITQEGSQETIRKINEIVEATNYIVEREAILAKKIKQIEGWFNEAN